MTGRIIKFVAFYSSECRFYTASIFKREGSFVPSISQLITKMMTKTMKTNQARNIDEYMAGFPKGIQHILEEIRAAIKKAAPEAEETIKYAIPTFTLKGNLVSFAAWKNHIGFYPAPAGIKKFEKELSAFEVEKSTLKFPLGTPVPLALIGKIVKFRVQKNLEKAKQKKLNRGSTRLKGEADYPPMV